MRHNVMVRWIVCFWVLTVSISCIFPGQAHAASNQAADKPGSFTQAAAMDLFSRYRQALVDVDYNGFLECIYSPGKPEGLPRVPREQVPKEFTMMRGFLLELSPDPAAAQVIQFTANDTAAILVIRVDLENSDYITLRALMFATDRGSWKVLPKVYDDTFPRDASEGDEKIIHSRLRDNPNLQQAAAVELAGTMTASGSGPAAQAAEPSGTMQAGKKLTDTREQSPPETGSVSGTVGEPPPLAYAFNDSPEHKAIIRKLRTEGKNQILQTASSVAMSKGKDFANVNITYSRQGESAQVEFYLFKEDGTWWHTLNSRRKKITPPSSPHWPCVIAGPDTKKSRVSPLLTIHGRTKTRRSVVSTLSVRN